VLRTECARAFSNHNSHEPTFFLPSFPPHAPYARRPRRLVPPSLSGRRWEWALALQFTIRLQSLFLTTTAASTCSLGHDSPTTITGPYLCSPSLFCISITPWPRAKIFWQIEILASVFNNITTREFRAAEGRGMILDDQRKHAYSDGIQSVALNSL
jgi:hypothetical protein